MSDRMRIDSDERGLSPEDAIMIEESHAPAETVVIFDREVSIDPLQSHRSEYRSTVALRKERPENKGELFKNPNR